MCTAVLIGRDPATPPSPRIWAHTRELLVSQDRRHLFVKPFFQPGRTSMQDIYASPNKQKKVHKVNFFQEDFLDLFFFYVRYSTLLHLPPFRFHCIGGCWDRTQDCCSKQSARSHPQNTPSSQLPFNAQRRPFSLVSFCLIPPCSRR
jgi:hypothetical protein